MVYKVFIWVNLYDYVCCMVIDEIVKVLVCGEFSEVNTIAVDVDFGII
jgi:hypothetical protein